MGLIHRFEYDVVEAYENKFNATRHERDDTNAINPVWEINKNYSDSANARFDYTSDYGFVPKQHTAVIFGSGDVVLNHYEFKAMDLFSCDDFHSVFFTGIESLFRQWPYLKTNDLPSTIIGFGAPVRFNAFELSFIRNDDHCLQLSLKPLVETNFEELAHRTFDLTEKFEVSEYYELISVDSTKENLICREGLEAEEGFHENLGVSHSSFKRGDRFVKVYNLEDHNAVILAGGEFIAGTMVSHHHNLNLSMTLSVDVEKHQLVVERNYLKESEPLNIDNDRNAIERSIYESRKGGILQRDRRVPNYLKYQNTVIPIDYECMLLVDPTVGGYAGLLDDGTHVDLAAPEMR
eukprot:TRINITY_DN5041_c0_g1_i2.p1 TRINITY_DN5041_c0_g1~~TRINITY_DN5041_c0_g1_i2.p1  ORF type:complete len:349 (+),score=72.11 TRINITY_DN5041_c0_g1_i2:282-1328(+)